jgi:23S rRNA pseudouridine1911/1915/1917 synthase
MKETIDLAAAVPAEFDGERLDQAAARLFPAYSRSRLQAWIKSGELRVDGVQRRPRDKVSQGDTLVVAAELVLEVGWQAQPIDLDIIFEDASILVLNKPAGLVVHPAAGHADGTLVNALLAHTPELAQLPRAGIVHRLDMETSGVMVVARSLSAHHHLVAQLQARSVNREYCAVCIGAMTGGGTIDAPMGRHPRLRKKMAVLSAGGKTAITHYRVTRRFAHHVIRTTDFFNVNTFTYIRYLLKVKFTCQYSYISELRIEAQRLSIADIELSRKMYFNFLSACIL